METFLFLPGHRCKLLEKGSFQFEMLQRFAVVIYDKNTTSDQSVETLQN